MAREWQLSEQYFLFIIYKETKRDRVNMLQQQTI